MPAGLADWRHPRTQRGEGKFHQSKSLYFSADPANGGWFSELVKRIIEGVAQEDSWHRRDNAVPTGRIQPGFARRIPGRPEQAAR